MGQYYKFIALNSHKRNCPNKDKIRASASTWDFNQGAKLMEFSYFRIKHNNGYIGIVERLINIDDNEGRLAGSNIVFAGDYADSEPNTWRGHSVNLYELSYDVGECIVKDVSPEPKHFRYIINRSKRKFFDTNRCEPVEDGWAIHPLPILCCEGNGRGGGDFRPKNKGRFVGAWARDVVVVSNNRPDEEIYKEVIYRFEEDR